MKKSLKKPFWAIAIIALSVTLAGWWFLKNDSHPQKTLIKTKNDQTIMVKPIQMPTYYQAPGTIQPYTESTLAAQITAKIDQVLVNEGDHVKKDQLLIKLDARDAKAQLAKAKQGLLAAKADYRLAKVTYSRIAKLLKPGYVTRNDYDQAQSQFLQAQANLKASEKTLNQAEIGLSYTSIKAPANAIVLERLVDPGDQATPGKSLLKLQTSQNMQLQASIPENYMDKIQLHQAIPLWIPSLNQTITGKVNEIQPDIDPNTRSFLIKVIIPKQDNLYPGMYGYAKIPTGMKTMLLIPENAIQYAGQLSLVNVLVNNQPERVFIRTGETIGKNIEVLSGINPEDRIIINKI